MNFQQWIDCIAKAHEVLEKEFPSHVKELLSREYIPDMSGNESIEAEVDLMIRYFFYKFAHGETFGPLGRIKEKFGSLPKENYPKASLLFLRFAHTYWTYRMELEDILIEYYGSDFAYPPPPLLLEDILTSHQGLILTVVLLEVERDIGSVFFPYPGPEVIWVRQRRETQRLLLETYAPHIDIKSFLNGNPLLGTSRGPIAQEVFNERVWASCLNRACRKFFQIPNTVKALRVTCPFCKKSFRFPAKDFRWLNRIPPYSHFNKKKAEELEKLRLEHNTPIEEFTLLVQCSDWCITRVLEFTLQQVRDQYPNASENELWKNVLKTRVESQRGSGSWDWLFSEQGYNDIIKKASSFQDLCDYIITVERPISLYGIIEEIDDVLDEE